MSSSTYSAQSTAASYQNDDSIILESLQRTYNSNSLKDAKPFLLRVFYAVKKCINFVCELSRVKIQQESEGLNFLQEYVKRWNAFSASIISLEKSFEVYNLLFNEVYDTICEGMPNKPEYSLMRTLVICWRRKVLIPIQDSLLDVICYLLQRQRQSFLHRLNLHEIKSLESEFYLLQKAVTSLVDLSVNEHSVHYTEHSRFYPDGTYNTLHSRVIQWTELFYRSPEIMCLDPGEKLEVLRKDLENIIRLFLPCTSVEVEKVNIHYQLDILSGHFIKKYLEFDENNSFKIPIQSEYLDILLNSELGRILFRVKTSDKSKERICSFLEYLNANNQLKDAKDYIDLYNRLDATKRLSDSDYEIEMRGEAEGLEMEQQPEERTLYSMATDVSLHQYISILSHSSFME